MKKRNEKPHRELHVLYASERLLIAEKPAGLPSVEGEGGGTDMVGLVNIWLAGQGREPHAMPCHRLDVQTEGLMLFALDTATKAAVRALMESGAVEKTYRCIVLGRPEPAHAVRTAYILKDAARSVVRVGDRPRPGAKTAITEYTVLKTDGERSLLEVRLHTAPLDIEDAVLVARELEALRREGATHLVRARDQRRDEHEA